MVTLSILSFLWLALLHDYTSKAVVYAAEENIAMDPSTMPRLPPGKHLGALTSFDVYPADQQALLDARLAEMRAAVGATDPVVHRIQLDWRDLEPIGASYDAAPLQEALAALSDERDYIFVLLATVDSEGVEGVRPPDLEATTFADELLWTRFQAVLENVVLPIFQANPRIFLLSVGNEPGSYLQANPNELLPLAQFLNQTRDFVHASVPDVAVSVTMDDIYREIADASDIVVFNQYGLKSDLTEDFLTAIDDPTDFVTTLRARQAIFGMDRPFVVQELGMPSGWQHQTSSMGTTPEFAAAVVRVMMQEFLENSSWRAAFWFTTVDWSVEITDFYLGALRGDEEIPVFLVDRLEEWLRTGGLLRYQQPPLLDGNATGVQDFSPRPAWFEFLAGLEAVSLANQVATFPPTSQPAATNAPTVFPTRELPETIPIVPTFVPSYTSGICSIEWHVPTFSLIVGLLALMSMH